MNPAPGSTRERTLGRWPDAWVVGAGPGVDGASDGALSSAVARALDDARVERVLLRRRRAADSAGADGSLTLLVPRADLSRVDAALRPLGLVRAPEDPQVGSRHYCGYDGATGSWSRIEVATELWYGAGARRHRLERGARLLARRHGSALSAVDELVDLLLRCLLDLGAFAPEDRERLRALHAGLAAASPAERRAMADTERWLAPALRGRELGAVIEAGRWDELLACRQAVARHLLHRAPVGHLWSWSLVALRGALAPRRARRGHRGLVVALLGPDGAGKTTLAQGLVHEQPLRARRIYMGTNREAGDALPVARWVARRREALGERARGFTWLAVKVLGFATHLAEEQYRHALARRHRAHGGIVVFDRYTLDANVNARLRRTPTSWVRRLRDALLQAGACRPDPVLVLDAPGEVLYARKGEHSPNRLEQMRRAYAALATECPEVVVIDASQDAGVVRRTVTSLLWARRCAGYAAVRTPVGAGRP